MTNRRGIAMLAALWLVVGITVVALEFSYVGRERRELGLAAADRVRASAAALGAFALTRAEMEVALRNGPQNATGNAARMQASDPWLGADSLFSGTQMVDSIRAEVRATDLGTMLNLNTLSEAELRTLFQNVLGDYVLADQLAQAISDWRDADDLPRTKGAERDDYIKAGRLRLPTNQPFRDVEELLDVMGMTPDIYAAVSPYLTTIGAAQINLNSAPVPVLRVLPGMTDEIIANILQMRSRGARITSVGQVMPRQRRGVSQRVAETMQTRNQLTERQVSERAGVETEQVMLTIIVRASPAAHPTRLRVVVQRANSRGQPAAEVTNEEWR